LLDKFLTHEQLQSFGWRIPFIVGCFIIPLIFIMRTRLVETQLFIHQAHKPQLNEVFINIGKYFPTIILCSLIVVLTSVSFYMLTAYIPTYAKLEINLNQDDAFLMAICVSLSNFILLPLMGSLSDKFGRFKLLLIFSSLLAITAYPVLNWLTKTPEFSHMLVSLLWLSFLFTGYHGSMAVALTEILNSNIRSTSFSLAYSMAAAVFGGFTPLIATGLIHITGNKAMPGLWLSFAALLSVTAILVLKAKNKFVDN
jgi:MFS family permease